MKKFTYILNLGNGQWFMASRHIYDFYKDIMILSNNYKDLKIVALKVITLEEQINLYSRFKIYKISPSLYYSSKEMSEAAERMGIIYEWLYDEYENCDKNLFKKVLKLIPKYSSKVKNGALEYREDLEYNYNIIQMIMTNEIMKKFENTIFTN